MRMTFIVGTGRCGSTLLHEIIAKHKDASFFTDFEDKYRKFNFLGKWGSTFYRNNHLTFTKKGKNRFIPTEGYRLISRKVSPIYVRPCRDLTADDVSPWLKDKFTRFFNQSYQKYGKPVFTHKYTGWSRIGFFSTIFPEAKFVHIVRDGRAVANSWLQMTWWGGYEGPENWLWGELSDSQIDQWKKDDFSYATLAGLGWNILMDSYDKSSQMLSNDKYLVIRYEDFLNEPEEYIRKILDFSELDWSNDFKHQFKKFTVRKGRAKAFENDLNSKQLEDLNNCISDKLIKYGYQ